MYKIAFCPTMAPYAQQLTDLPNIQMLALQSAGQSLAALKRGQADAVLIGRYAKSRELDADAQEEILKGGYTLVYKMKTGIGEDQLKQIAINTYLPAEKIKTFLPLFGEIRYFESLDACLQDHLETPVLIDWRDMRDAFELLIPMNAAGKTPLGRAPVLYHKGMDSETLGQIRAHISIK